jgi:hypothetical protein
MLMDGLKKIMQIIPPNIPGNLQKPNTVVILADVYQMSIVSSSSFEWLWHTQRLASQTGLKLKMV